MVLSFVSVFSCFLVQLLNPVCPLSREWVVHHLCLHRAQNHPRSMAAPGSGERAELAAVALFGVPGVALHSERFLKDIMQP